MSESEQEFEEENVLNWLNDSGWTVKTDGEEPIGGRYDRKQNEVIYWDVLEEKIRDINDVSDEGIDSIINKIKQNLILNEDLLKSNKNAMSILRSGGVYTDSDGNSQSFNIFDFDNIEDNEFVAFNQFTYEDTNPYVNRRPDIVLFVNGIPLVVVELKNIGSHSTTTDAIDQIRNTYEDEIAPLFVSNLFNIAMNQNRLLYGAVGASKEHYNYWKEDGSEIVSDTESNFKDLISPYRLLDILKRFIFFKKITGDQSYAKIIPRHPQYFATKRIIDDVSGSENVDEYGQNLIVHVQGSGKTYAMIFAAHILRKEMNYPVYIVVDDKEILDQFDDDLSKIEEINATVVDSDKGNKTGEKQLEEAVESGKTDIILTIIHLFNELDDSVESPRPSIVLADEAHRFLNKILGSKLDSTLNNYHYYGFTGTPIKETYEHFNTGKDMYLHNYSMENAINENAILPVSLRSRVDMLRWDINRDIIDTKFDEKFSGLTEKEKRRHICDVVGTEELAGIESRIDAVIEDIIEHFTRELQSGEINYKGMVVTKGKENAAKYGLKLREKLGYDAVDVLYSASNGDSKEVQEWHKTKEERREVIDNFKTENENPQLLVVCDMLRTGFDSPILRTIYLDRRFDGGHTFLQTIARTNRPLSTDSELGIEKEFGEIIDYQGITEEIDDLINYDENEIEAFTSEDKEQFKDEFKKQLDELSSFFEQDFEEDELDKKEWTDNLNSLEVQKNFMSKYRKLRSLYTNIQPDEFVVKYDSQYKWYTTLYDAVLTHTKTNEEDIQEGLIDAVKMGVDVNQKENYREKQNIFGEFDASPLSVSKKKASLEEIMRQNQIFDPRYEKLSERIEDIIRKWNQEYNTTEETLEELEHIENEAKDLKSEIESSELDNNVRTIKSVLITYDIEDNDAEEIAGNILFRFESNAPTTRKWWKKKDKRDTVKKIINDELYEYIELLNNTDIETQILKYIIQLKR